MPFESATDAEPGEDAVHELGEVEVGVVVRAQDAPEGDVDARSAAGGVVLLGRVAAFEGPRPPTRPAGWRRRWRGRPPWRPRRRPGRPDGGRLPRLRGRRRPPRERKSSTNTAPCERIPPTRRVSTPGPAALDGRPAARDGAPLGHTFQARRTTTHRPRFAQEVEKKRGSKLRGRPRRPGRTPRAVAVPTQRRANRGPADHPRGESTTTHARSRGLHANQVSPRRRKRRPAQTTFW